MIQNIDHIINELEKKKTLKLLLILTRANLTNLPKEYVESQFKRVYEFLISEEDFETCKQLKDIEDKYKKE